MTILELIILIAVCGFICYLIMQIPMAAPFKNIIIGILCFAAVIAALKGFGLIHGFPGIRLW